MGVAAQILNDGFGPVVPDATALLFGLRFAIEADLSSDTSLIAAVNSSEPLLSELGLVVKLRVVGLNVRTIVRLRVKMVVGLKVGLMVRLRIGLKDQLGVGFKALLDIGLRVKLMVGLRVDYIQWQVLYDEMDLLHFLFFKFC
ncbi:hypothetical protein ACOSQ4_024597 [Xanthoceras sorbifolium]